MAIGRTFGESFAKAMRSRELDSEAEVPESDEALLDALEKPCSERFDLILAAFRRGLGVEAGHGRRLPTPRPAGRPRRARPAPRGVAAIATRSSSSAPAPTGSARGSSSTTAA